MNLTQTCPNCNGTMVVKIRSVIAGIPKEQICSNCYRTSGKVPTPEGMELLKFIKQFEHWQQYKVVEHGQVEVESK